MDRKIKERRKIEKWVGLASWAGSTGHARASSQGAGMFEEKKAFLSHVFVSLLH